MRIGDVARRTGVSARMLRYYEQQDLLRPARHPNGYREYSAADAEAVEVIRDLGDSGVPTRFIKIVLDRRRDPGRWTEACDDALTAMVQEQLASLESKIASLELSRTALRDVLRGTADVV